ncbi:hypothetical protein MKW98_007962 [Papaver atlanticum]|uniref:Uncharacterized protein n=1 Tax=Papaver atlanticum TaxID=357466 RepID=A0AAD4S5Y7_9MAGN|nr:hypothetical protein MKW98_007962 [Papaver atlanticum]
MAKILLSSNSGIKSESNNHKVIPMIIIPVVITNGEDLVVPVVRSYPGGQEVVTCHKSFCGNKRNKTATDDPEPRLTKLPTAMARVNSRSGNKKSGVITQKPHGQNLTQKHAKREAQPWICCYGSKYNKEDGLTAHQQETGHKNNS